MKKKSKLKHLTLLDCIASCDFTDPQRIKGYLAAAVLEQFCQKLKDLKAGHRISKSLIMQDKSRKRGQRA